MDYNNGDINAAADMEEIVSGDKQLYPEQEVEMSTNDDMSYQSNHAKNFVSGAEQNVEYDNSVHNGYDVDGDNKIEDVADTESDNDREIEEEDSLSVTEERDSEKDNIDSRSYHHKADVDKTNEKQELRENDETCERGGGGGRGDINETDRFTNVVHPQEEHGRRSSRTPKPRVVYFAELPPVAHTNNSSHGHNNNNNNNNNSHHNNNHHANTRGSNNHSNNSNSSNNNNNNSNNNQENEVHAVEDGDDDLESSDGQSGLGNALPALKKFFTMRLEQVILYLGGAYVT